MDNNIETAEISFLNKVHEVTSKADLLIEKYVDTATIIATLPPEMDLPNQKEAYELATDTAETLAELRTLVALLVEHNSKIKDKVESALLKLETPTKE